MLFRSVSQSRYPEDYLNRDKYINKGMKPETIVKIMKQIVDNWENGRWTLRSDIIKAISND